MISTSLLPAPTTVARTPYACCIPCLPEAASSCFYPHWKDFKVFHPACPIPAEIRTRPGNSHGRRSSGSHVKPCPYHEIRLGSMYSPFSNLPGWMEEQEGRCLPCTNCEVLGWELLGTILPSPFTGSLESWNKFRVKSLDAGAWLSVWVQIPVL